MLRRTAPITLLAAMAAGTLMSAGCGTAGIGLTHLGPSFGFAAFPVPITAYAQKMLVLAACVILRISNSHLRPFVDLDRGKEAYFTTVQLHRKMSVQDGDLASRTTVILTELWSSRRAFRTRDGNNDSLVLSCRSRLSMSVVFDSFWRWRREFAGQATPYEESHVDNSESPHGPFFP